MRWHAQIVRFLAVSAWDLLLPDFIDMPLKLCQNFYHYFLATDPQDKFELLSEAGNLSNDQVEELVDALAAEWKSMLPDGRLSDAQRALLRQLIDGLQSASCPVAINPSEVLRQSLNGSVLSCGGQQLAQIALAPDQKAVGRSLIHAALSDKAGGRGPRPLPPDAPAVPGYQLLRVVGDGGFSVVYLATHTATGELRAVKVGPLDYPGRFQREVRLLSALSGPHVVRYHEHGQLPGQFWIAMEYLGEFTLADLIRSRPTAEQALLLAEQVLRGLESLHKAGVIHRDLTPGNALVGEDLRLRLIDFGLAKPLPGSALARTMSLTDGLIGTPRYMSPEQIRNAKTLTPAIDLWGFGCILYELLTGRPLFESDNVMALGHEIMTREVRVNLPEVPVEVRDFLKRCLERDPAQRWSGAGEALQAFSPVAAEARRRLRHERYRETWEAILERELLERFAAGHKGRLPPNAIGQFAALARQEGVAEVDEERLKEILGPIFACQEQVIQAEQAIVRAKQQLQQEATRLSGSELATEVDYISALEKTHEDRQKQVRAKIEELLAEELQSWQKKQEAERQRQEALRVAEQQQQDAECRLQAVIRREEGRRVETREKLRTLV